MGEKPDNIYAAGTGVGGAFEFNDEVAEVFPDMIRRSVPGYRTTLQAIGVLAGRYAQPGTTCYDLGCSLGAATLAIRHGVSAEGVRIVAVDNSAAMVRRCREAVAADQGHCPVDVLQADIRQLALEVTSVVAMNFTLQFVPPGDRAALLGKIAAALVPGGVLVLSEKLRFDDPRVDELFVDLHHRYKRARGYSELEIAAKRQALEQVLIPETLSAHRERILAAGFKTCDSWFQCFNFASLIAIK